MQDFKQVMVIRKDLDLGCGKIAAQVAHASLGAYLVTMRERREWVESWSRSGSKKIVARVNSQEELFQLVTEAQKMGIPYFVVSDAGLTQVPPNTVTCAGFGPGPEELIDRITGRLRLL